MLNTNVSHFSVHFKKSGDFKVNIKSILVQINRKHPDNFYPYDRGNFHFAIHSPNTLSVLSHGKDFMLLNNSLSYSLRYSRVETRLLGNGFDTNCFDYNLDHKFANHNMRSDCITSCLMENSSCSPDHFINIKYLLRKQLFKNKVNITAEVCHINDVMGELYMKRKEMECMSRCRKDCT